MSPNPDEKPEGYLVSATTLKRLGDGDVGKGRARVRLALADERARGPIAAAVEKPLGVRLATIRDEPAILDLLLEDLAENAAAVAPPSVKQIMRNVEVATRNRGGFAPVVDGPDGSPAAVAILIPTNWWWSDQQFLSETVLYVHPSVRGSGAADRLLQYERWLAQEISAQLGHTMFVLAGVTATRRRAAKVRLYRRHMHPLGAFFISPMIEGMDI